MGSVVGKLVWCYLHVPLIIQLVRKILVNLIYLELQVKLEARAGARTSRAQA